MITSDKKYKLYFHANGCEIPALYHIYFGDCWEVEVWGKDCGKLTCPAGYFRLNFHLKELKKFIKSQDWKIRPYIKRTKGHQTK